jgi:threonine synthase
MKDEGIIPTGTFKARGAAVGVSKAKELGVRELAMPTNGNAGFRRVIRIPKNIPETAEKPRR